MIRISDADFNGLLTANHFCETVNVTFSHLAGCVDSVSLSDGDYIYYMWHSCVAVAIRAGQPYMKVLRDFAEARDWFLSGARGGSLASEWAELWGKENRIS